MFKKNTIEIISPSRLHFGFLEISRNNDDGTFGGIGLSIDKFNTKIKVKRNSKTKVEGKSLNKAFFFLNTFCKKKEIKPNFLINVEDAPSQHTGLGSGTALALSIGKAISELSNLNLEIEKIGKILNRNRRSNIGLLNFKEGGFLIDLKIKKKSFTNINKILFPEEWKIILIKDSKQGLHGKKEIEAFKRIKKIPKKNISLTGLVIKEIYPSLIENNFEKFCKAITKLQNVMGEYFNLSQGGRFSSPEVYNILNFLKKENILGYGQTSWGPNGFAFFPNLRKAKEMRLKLKRKFSSCKNLEFIICSGRNNGADIRLK